MLLFVKKWTIIKLNKLEGWYAIIKIYKTKEENLSLEQLKEITPGSWIDVINPTEKEIEKLSDELSIDAEFINYILDDEEQPRIDSGKDKKLIMVDVPIQKEKRGTSIIKTTPLAILIVRDDYIVTISKKNNILDDFKNGKVKEFYTFKKSRFTIQILYRVATAFLKYLRGINEQIEKCEEKMFATTKNTDLERLLAIEKSLVYLLTSLRSNKIVLDKLYKRLVLDFYEEDQELLDDAIIENDQALDMAHLYKEILTSTTDSFATIISNNLNSIMKFLAGITIVISIPTMVSSFFGMNVPLGILKDNPYSFVIILLFSVIVSIIVAIILKRKNML